MTYLKRSVDFYANVFNLVEMARGGSEIQRYVLFKDRASGQRLELNWYGAKSEFAVPYVPARGWTTLE